MRLFQSAGFGQKYLTKFNRASQFSVGMTFDERRRVLLDDRYDATHILKPVYDENPDCYFTVCDDSELQLAWASEYGLKSNDLTDILLAQIEESRSEVVYQLDPIQFPSSFVRRLPGSVKKTIAWRAALSAGADFSAYDLVVSNFETLNAQWRAKGWRTAFFSPAWDPAMEPYSANLDRPIDVFFAGSYARANGHEARLAFLDAIANMDGHHTLELRLMRQKWGRLTSSGLGKWIPVPVILPKGLASSSQISVFGRDMYAALSRAKIVLNPATDIAGNVRGNMRCWEALGCGACMLGSAGKYPEGFEPGVNFETFTDIENLKYKINRLLADEPRRAAMAKAGAEMLSNIWSKERQWDDFVALVDL